MENSKAIKSIIVVQDFLSLLLPFCFYKVFIVDKNANIWAVSLFFLYILANILFNFKYRMVELSKRNKKILWIFMILAFVLGLIAVFWGAK
jgi:uncharacterized protein involved in response to NO